jgi:hypothetical protein
MPNANSGATDAAAIEPRKRSLPAVPLAVREWVFLLNQRRRLQRIARFRAPADDPTALVDAVRRKHLVFTVTAGRSGTTYLTHLFELLPDITSLHEPQPSFVYFLRQAQRSPAIARRFLLDFKLPFIAGHAATRYAETGHLLCKGCFEPLLDLGIVPRIVLLRRHPRLIATSLLTRRTVPGRGKLGFKYLVHPSDPGVLPLAQWTGRTDYQLCFWYALEIERRQRAYAARLERAGGTSVDVTPDELRDGDRFLAVLDALQLIDRHTDREALLQRHREVSGVIYNPNPRAPVVVAQRDAEEEAVWEAIAPHAPWLRADVAKRYG